MKKRLLSLLVALCMAVTLLPVSAITAWAEEGGSTLKPLQFKRGLPVTDGIRPTTDSNEHTIYTGDGWSYDDTAKVLTIAPENPTTYDLKAACLTQNSIACSIIIKENATITDGSFINNITNYGTITGGVFKPLSSKSLTFENSGIITGGEFLSALGSLNFTNSISGTIEGGIFSVSSLSNSGAINGGVFPRRPNGGKVAAGYTLNVESPDSTTEAGIEYFKDSRYIIPHSSYTTSITVLYYNPRGLQPFPIDVTIDNTQQMLLTEWAGKVESSSDPDGLYVTFTAPSTDAETVTLSKLTRLVIDKDGYPVGTKGGTQGYSGNGWSYNHTDKTLTLNPSTPTSYDFSGEEHALRPLNPNVQLVVESGATLTGGAFKNEPTVKGAGTDTFKKVILKNGTGSITAVNGLASDDWGKTLYAVKTGDNTITASEPIRDINLKAIYDDVVYPTQGDLSTILLNVGWLEYHGYIEENTNIVLNQGTYSTLKMADDGTPITTGLARISDGNLHTYFGNGWHSQALSGDPDTVYLESGNYNFLYTDPVNKKGENLRSVNCGIVNEGGIIEDGTFSKPIANGQPGSTSSEHHEIEGGTFAAGLLYNDGMITGGAFNGKDSVLNKLSGSTVVSDTALSGDYRSVTVNGGAIVKVNDTLPLVPDKTGLDLVQGSAWDLYSYAGTVLIVESNVDITNINGQEIGKAFNSYYLNGETNKKVVCFEMPDSDVELNSTKIVVPDPKPEPTPDPTPEAPTYTLTVKGGTFTYNGGEAMTSANVPVDAEVKVTLNQSAVPEGMVFDLWAMDEASLLGNPAVAYNQESFTIPAGSVAKGSTVTVEAQYRDATIESEPSILGTAAIIGVAGAGTAVIVWQGYRIGMELYEKYFQPTPEETAVVEPTLEGQMTDPIS